MKCKNTIFSLPVSPTRRTVDWLILTEFEFPVLLVLLHFRVAGLLYIKRVGPDQI
jgi:uncharacterized integral membrane protein